MRRKGTAIDDAEAKHLYLQLAERWRQLAIEVELFPTA
jgi:hypothetical protein